MRDAFAAKSRSYHSIKKFNSCWAEMALYPAHRPQAARKVKRTAKHK
jgi:hypothetical protein